MKTPKKKLSAIQTDLKKATGQTSPFTPEGQAWLAKRKAEREKRDKVLHLHRLREDFLVLRRVKAADKKRPHMTDGFWLYDFTDKTGRRRLELGIRRHVLGSMTQVQAELSRAEAITAVRYLNAFIDGEPRVEHLPLPKLKVRP